MEFWHKYGEPITGLSIILFLVFAVVMINGDRKLKEEINENCGWDDEDYKCYCEKSEAMVIKNKIENNVTIDWENINASLVS